MQKERKSCLQNNWKNKNERLRRRKKEWIVNYRRKSYKVYVLGKCVASYYLCCLRKFILFVLGVFCSIRISTLYDTGVLGALVDASIIIDLLPWTCTFVISGKGTKAVAGRGRKAS